MDVVSAVGSARVSLSRGPSPKNAEELLYRGFRLVGVKSRLSSGYAGTVPLGEKLAARIIEEKMPSSFGVTSVRSLRSSTCSPIEERQRCRASP